jgi:hypothetical protein
MSSYDRILFEKELEFWNLKSDSLFQEKTTATEK